MHSNPHASCGLTIYSQTRAPHLNQNGLTRGGSQDADRYAWCQAQLGQTMGPSAAALEASQDHHVAFGGRAKEKFLGPVHADSSVKHTLT